MVHIASTLNYINKCICTFICLNLITIVLFSQNIVKNGSFENINKTPIGLTASNLNAIKYWIQPTYGSSDFFCKKCPSEIKTPYNSMGYQFANTGNSYIGLILYSKNKKNYREYFQTKLSKPLEQNRLYCVGMFVSLAEGSIYTTNNIGILLSSVKIERKDTKFFINNPQIKSSTYLNDTSNWTCINGIYKALGSEQYLTLGSFNKNKFKENIAKNDNYNGDFHKTIDGNSAYYYVDDVFVFEINDSCDCDYNKFLQNNFPSKSQVNSKKSKKKGGGDLSKNVLFASNEYNLDQLTKKVLDSIVDLINEDNVKEITIAGYTDDLGSDDYNLKLSEMRANSVANYFVEQGVSIDLLKITGQGIYKFVNGSVYEGYF